MGSVAQGYYSLVRWRPDVTRDEAKNVGVLLLDPASRRGTLRALPISSVSPRLREQGLVDGLLESLRARLETEAKAGLETLVELHEQLQRSLYVTEPRPVAIGIDFAEVLDSLFRSYCAHTSTGRSVTKAVVLDRVVASLRARGYGVTRGADVRGFIFDALVGNGDEEGQALGVLSFVVARKDWTPVLHDAGHFLYALDRTRLPGLAVIQPPTDLTPPPAHRAFERVEDWLKNADVTWRHPTELEAEQGSIF